MSASINDHRYVFENLTVLKNKDLKTDTEWFQKLSSNIPNFVLDQNDMSRTIIVQDSVKPPAVYSLKFNNNVAECVNIFGDQSPDHLQKICQLLRKTLEVNCPNKRLLQESGYKLFAYTSGLLNLQPGGFTKTNDTSSTTILGDQRPPSTTEWSYTFTFKEQVSTMNTWGTPSSWTPTTTSGWNTNMYRK